jgi:hypothetical protein
MSDRERWIVYPLLFLTLGVALRNQFFPTRRFGAVDLRAGELSAQRIRCNQLVVNDKANCRELKFNHAEGNTLKSGRIEAIILTLPVRSHFKPAPSPSTPRDSSGKKTAEETEGEKRNDK